MSRADFLEATDALIRTGEGLLEDPEWDGFRAWLLESDRLLERVWGRMDRYHLAWLNVGRDSAPPGSDLDAAGITRDKNIICYCRIGERSSHTWFVLKYLLGYPLVRNYDGSWTEWGNMIGNPIEK